MAESLDLTERRAAAFQHARDVVQDWRSAGKRTTTAGVTSALKKDGGLDLEALGMSTNREFWDHVANSGLLDAAQQPNGHWLLLLPGETLDEFIPEPPPNDIAETPAPDVDLRLKSDVWTSFVDWNPSFRRFWDSHNARAFMVPIAPGWGPTDLDTSRFTEIHPARQDKQISWMRDFADQHSAPDRDGLLASLVETAPRGAFRRELRDRGLSRAWRLTLQNHILTEAVGWARSAGIDVPTIMDGRTRDPAGARTTDHSSAIPRSGKASRVAGASRNAETSAASPIGSAVHEATQHGQRHQPHILHTQDPVAVPPSGHQDALAVLRAEVHRIIDLMSWDELAHLPVSARYLVRP